MASSMGYHEAEDSLSSATKDRHRAIASLQESADGYKDKAQRYRKNLVRISD